MEKGNGGEDEKINKLDGASIPKSNKMVWMLSTHYIVKSYEKQNFMKMQKYNKHSSNLLVVLASDLKPVVNFIYREQTEF